MFGSTKFSRLFVSAGVLALAALACGAPASAAEKVTLRLDWTFGAEHAPIFLAQEKGFFREAGIDLQLLPGEGSSVTTKLVGNRDADFGYATADQVLLARSRELPVVSTAVVLQINPTALIFRQAKPVRDPRQDLYGKTIGVQLKSNTGRQWEALRKTLALDTSRLREVPADGALVPLLASGRIDVGVGFYFNDALKLKATGEDVGWILLEDLGMKMYSTALITNDELLAEKPELVEAMTRAFLRGWQYSLEHPDEALAAFLKANPTTDRKYAELKLPEVLKLTQSDDVAKNGLGHSTDAGWNGLQDQLLSMGLQTGKTDISKVYTNRFLLK